MIPVSDRNESGAARHGLRDPAVLAWLRLARVYHKVDQASAAQMRSWRLPSGQLSVAQFDVLAHIGAAPGLTQQELATALLVTKGNICQLLNRMERDGLIERVAEGRMNRLYLTPAGRALFDEVVPAHEELISRLFDSLGAEDQSTLLRLLRGLDRALPE
jgi:DNA-binding MarR family transcriptional regulator